MSTTFEQDARQFAIRDINHARECIEEGNLAGAKGYLDRARSKADDQLRMEIQSIEREQIQDLEARIQSELNADEYDEGRVQSLIDQLEGWAPDHERAAVWREEAREQGERWQAAQRIKTVREEVEGYLAEANALQERGADLQFVEETYRSAIRTAKAARGNFPKVLDFVDLATRATSEYNRYREESTLLTTLGATGQFRQALLNLKELEPTEKVRVFNLAGQMVGFMARDEAQERYNKIAHEYVMARTPEKIEEARRILQAEHAPDGAYEVLLDFQMKVEGFMPDVEKDAIAKVIREEIEPARQARREARRLLAEAETLPLTEIAQAWDRMQQARLQDPHAPDLERVEATLRQRLQGNVERLLAEGEKLLGERRLDDAGQRVEEALEKSALDHSPELAALQSRSRELKTRVQAAKSQAKDVDDTLAAIRRLLDRKAKPEEAGQEARQKWEALKDRLGETASEYPEIDKVGTRLTKFLDLAQVLTSLETVLQGRDEEALGDCLQELEEVKGRYPEKKDVISEYERRIKARQAFLEAERAVDTGSLVKAERLLQIATRGDDKDQAVEWLQKIREGKRRDTEAQRDLQQAGPLLQGKSETAYGILLRWRQDRWIPSRDQVADAWRQLAAAWQPKVETELESLLQVKPGMLNVSRIRFLVEEVLASLGAARAQGWRERALPRCYGDLAILSEEAGDWSQAVRYWTEAIKESSAEELASYRGRLENSLFQEEMHKIDLTSIDALKTMDQKYPRSIEVKRRLAELHLDRREMGEARGQAQRGLALIEQLELGQVHGPVLEKVLSRVDQIEAAAEHQKEVERLVAPERSVEDYAQAPGKARELIQQFPELDGELEIWWRELRERAVRRLEQQIESLEPIVGSTFDQIDIASRILCLDKNHRGAQGKLRQLDVSVEELGDQVRTLQANADGQGLSTDPALALREHLRQATALRDQARKARQAYDQFGTRLGERRPENITDLIKTLETMVNHLEKFQAELGKAMAGLSMAKASGDWSVVDTTVNEIRDLGFAQHQSAKYLEQEVKVVRERRGKVEELADRIEEDWKNERFREVQAGLGQMKDEASGDPEGEYGIGPMLSLKDQEGRVLARGIRDCEELAAARQAQVDEMEGWIQRLRSWANWPEAQQRADDMVSRGEFAQALQSCQRVLGNPQTAGDPAGRSGEGTAQILEDTTLEQALAYLKQPPLLPERLSSRRAQAVWNEAEEKRREVEGSIAEAREYIEGVRQKQRDWDKVWEELKRAKGNLNRLTKAGPPILGWMRRFSRRNEISNAEQRLAVAVAACRDICPQYPVLRHL